MRGFHSSARPDPFSVVIMSSDVFHGSMSTATWRLWQIPHCAEYYSVGTHPSKVLAPCW